MLQVVRARSIPSLVPARPCVKYVTSHSQLGKKDTNLFHTGMMKNAKEMPSRHPESAGGIQIPAGSSKPWGLFKYLKWKRGGKKKQLQEVIPALIRSLSIEPLLMTIFLIRPSSAQHGQFAQFPRDTLLTTDWICYCLLIPGAANYTHYQFVQHPDLAQCRMSSPCQVYRLV